MTVTEELIRIVKQLQQRGIQTAELSAENLRVLGRRPMPRATQAAPTAMPDTAQRQAAVQRFTQATGVQPGPQRAPVTPPPAPAPRPAARPVNFDEYGLAPVGIPTRRVVIAKRDAIPADGPFPPAPDVTAANWEQLTQCCLSCQSCRLAKTRTNVVIEDGCRTAPLMFIGEGPGADEDAQGKPFVGKAGQLLTAMIKAMGRDRTSTDPAHAAYIANIVKCRPPANRNPFTDESSACIGYLRRQIALVQPKVIVLLGNVPLQALFGQGGITRARGNWLDYNGIPVMPTFHPAYLLRFERTPADFIANKRLVWQDLQQVMAKLNA